MRWLPGRTESKRRKYGNVKVGGFDSKKESARYAELQLAVKANVVRDLRRQQRFELIPSQEGERPAFYTADFSYQELQACDTPGGRWVHVVEDCKSEATRRNEAYILRRKLMLHVHGIRIRET